MKKDEIRVGGLYEAKVNGRYTTVRVDDICENSTHPYTVTNLSTGRQIMFRSAAKFRREVKPEKASVYGKGGSGRDAAAAQAQIDVQEASEENCPTVEPTATTAATVSPTLPSHTEGEQSSDPTQVMTSGVPSVTSQPAAVTVSGLAARIAATASAPTTCKLTAEQQDILCTAKLIEQAYADGQRIMVIAAGAGTGKTFVLKQLEQVLCGNGQYTAFNASLVAESKAKFTRAACNTTHSLAFRAVGHRFKHRLNSNRMRSQELAYRLGIEDFYVHLPECIQPRDENGNPAIRRIKATYLAGQVMEAIKRFCMSAERSIGPKHFKTFSGLDEQGQWTNSNKVRDYLLPFAEKAWIDLQSEQGTLPFAHDHYVKIWQLGTGKDRPIIAADYILLDEAQDTAPVMLDILMQQTHALIVLVGDDNQSIYAWRGAVNAMAAFPGAPRRLLSQSFRFGQTVADVANSILAGLEQATDLIMRGLESIPTRVCEVEQPRCYIYRTNAGAIGRLMTELDSNRRGHLIGGSKETIAFCEAAIDLQQGRGTSHPELGCFTTWDEVVVYAAEDEGQDLRLMVKLIKAFTAEKIVKALKGMPTEEQADFVVSTAHRTKGREWSTVQLGQDFPTADKLGDEERRLLYVAGTRAQEELDISKCPTFCGGYNRKEEDSDQMGDGGRFVPGIEVRYTTPMPTPEAVAAYRMGRPARNGHATANPPAPAPAVPVAVPAAANGTANGTPRPAQPVQSEPERVRRTGLPADPGYSWISYNGSWVIEGPPDEAFTRGKGVMVPSRAGVKEIFLYTILKRDGFKWVYGVDETKF